MVDRIARESLCQLLAAHLDRPLDPDRFERAVQRIAHHSDDPAVKYASGVLQDTSFDELNGDATFFDKYERDHVWRVLLLLKSECELQVNHRVLRFKSQVVAGVIVAVFLVIAAYLGIGARLLVASMLCAVPAIIIAIIQRRPSDEKGSPWQPFTSVGQILRVRRQASGFPRKRLRRIERAETGPLGVIEFIGYPLVGVMLLLLLPFGIGAALAMAALSPLLLVMQVFPKGHEEFVVIERPND